MLLSKILGTVGRSFITLGVMTLLFVSYQLWGTGILTAQAQAELEDDFEALLEEADVVGLNSEIVGDGSDLDAVEPELTAEQAEAQLKLANLLWQPEGNAVAQLLIPDIGVTHTVVSGVGTEALRKGPGHYTNTPLPGMEGNASIAGHRTTWGAPFNRIDELEPGDEITVRTLQGTFVYRVVAQENGKGHFIVSPNRVDVLDQDFEDHPNRLTLTACHPKFSARQRIIVVAELVGEPAQFIPKPEGFEASSGGLASEDFDASSDIGADIPGDADLIAADADEAATDETDDTSESGDATNAEPTTVVVGGVDAPDAAGPGDEASARQGTTDAENFGEGLNGDREAILPAVMWGLAAAAIWISMGFLGRRWKKWPSYAVGIVPFALVLFVCFINIDKAIPSY